MKDKILSRVSDRRRGIGLTIGFITQIQYNWVSSDSLSLIVHDSMYHDNSAVTVSTATALLACLANTILVAAELQSPICNSDCNLKSL
jgi:hypothetical protein